MKYKKYIIISISLLLFLLLIYFIRNNKIVKQHRAAEYSDIGMQFKEEKKYDKALEYLDKAIEYYPTDLLLHCTILILPNLFIL
jgi:tetratricopeptide (TPR) repeat protein